LLLKKKKSNLVLKMQATKREMEDLLFNNKPKKAKLKTLFNFDMPACLQNTLDVRGWRKGDPNDETTQAYDLLWLVWALRHIFPKDVVTHFINLNGGMGFTLYRFLPIAGCMNDSTLALTFWRDRECVIPENTLCKSFA
jgi:hypothetical protein